MDALKKKKATTKGQLTRLKQQMEAVVKAKVLNIENLAKLRAIMVDYRRLRDTFEELVTEILNTADETEEGYGTLEKKCLDELDVVNDTLHSYEAEIEEFQQRIAGEKQRESIVASVSSQNISPNSSFRVDNSFTPKLEEIKVPKFDGEILNFPNFKGLYENLIHNNGALSGVQKMHYLKKACEDGKAEKLIRDFPLTDAAYSEAWALVLSRFDNKRAMLRTLFKQLANLKPINSPGKLRDLLDEVEIILRGIKAAGEKIDDTFSRFIAYFVATRLDKKTGEDWENSITATRTFPLFNDLEKFIQGRMFSAESSYEDKAEKAAKPLLKLNPKNKPKSAFAVSQKSESCALCKGSHSIQMCTVFLSKSAYDRFILVKKMKLCFVCFGDHGIRSCPNTASPYKCSCGKLHHHLLHFNFSNSNDQPCPKMNEEKKANDADKKELELQLPKTSLSCSKTVKKNELVLLPSAVVKFRCGNKTGRARILLDSCSQPTLAADTFVKKFKLPTFRTNSSIKGVAESSVGCSSGIRLTLWSRNNEFSIDIEAEIIPASCLSYSADTLFPYEIIEKLKGLQLAEPCLAETNACIDSVDIVVGAQYYAKCILDGAAVIDSLDLRRSHFGWLVAGVAPVRKVQESKFCGFTLNQINENLVKFWEIENVETSSRSLSSEEEECVKHFESNYSFAEDGKFVVRLPIKSDRREIANTRKRAEKALVRVENKLSSELKSAYSAFMKEYELLGHMSLVKNTSEPAYYIPHREVIRESSSTTPLRVVFNASAKTFNKLSLNEALMTGPALQRDIFDILVGFRLNKMVFVGDIEKMYRMIWVHPDDRNLQRILWRTSPDEQFSEFQLNTITYGTAPASFIAQKCLVTIAESCESEMPEVAKAIKENFYMDDLNVGTESEAELIELGEKIRAVLLKYGFNLRKFASNSRAFLDSMPQELRAASPDNKQGELTVLGVKWCPEQDEIGVCENLEYCETSGNVSRRIALSAISKTFDPLGLFAPVLITGKMLLQEFWKEGKDWDALTSDEIDRKFRSYVENAKSLSNIRIPRPIYDGELKSIYAFGDASGKAYCSVIYARYLKADGSYCCRLICSKTRVAPMKELSIPKLELQAAKLVADLVNRICADLVISKEKVIAFSDSTTVLCWLSKPLDSWKVFVKNRVDKIVDIIPFENWRYVKSHANPADMATRGLSAEEFCENLQKWFDGPEFTTREDADLFFPVPDLSTHECLEKRKIKSRTFACVLDTSCSRIIERFSSYTRLLNTFARLVRLAKFWKTRVRDENSVFSKSEYDNARNIIIRMCQSESFNLEIERLKSGAPLKKKSSIRSLDPFLDENFLLRVGGRLTKNTSLPLEKMHPLIVSGKSPFIRLYCRYIHEKYFHAGKKFLLAFLAAEFWIHKGRTNMVKGVIRNCVTCRRLKGQTAVQIMGQLPLPRISIAKPFTYVGIDYAGYFWCKCTAHRSTKFYHVYAAIFVCLTTRAVHIEVVTDTTADALIEAVLCMISRRGLPRIIYSDNGPNMSGADTALTLDEERLKTFATHERFEWRFIPPASPHFGGIWEAAVKSAKWHLSAASKGQVLSLVEYGNLFRRIEAILNSRPLCYRKDAEQGSEVITPAHFLVGNSLLALPIIDYADKIPFSRRLELLQSQVNGFWKVWSRDYINQLQQRNRWTSREPNLQKGQIVLIKSKGEKPFQWPLGRILKVFPDPDGNVRVAEVLFRGKSKLRSISSLVPLLSEKEFARSENKNKNL